MRVGTTFPSPLPWKPPFSIFVLIISLTARVEFSIRATWPFLGSSLMLLSAFKAFEYNVPCAVRVFECHNCQD